MTKLERRNASDPLDKSTFADLFGPGYLGEREEGEKQISAPSLPPQPQQKRRMDIPASSDPLEKVFEVFHLRMAVIFTQFVMIRS